MQRIDDDARQPRRIELAFLQIEFPGAVLLRHQAPLQPVGKPRDHALQIRQLLVEIAAQAVEFLRLAQILGRDRLVELGGEGAIVRTARLVGAEMARPLRLARAFRRRPCRCRRPCRRSALRRLRRRHRACPRRTPACPPCSCAASRRNRRLRRPRRIPACGAPPRPRLLRPRNCGCGPRPFRARRAGRAPRRRTGAGPRRRFSSRSRSRPARSSISGRQRSTSFLAAGGGAMPGQALAHHQRQRVLDRRVGALGDLVEFAAVKALVQHGGEILRDAIHAPRADRLDARLLDRLEHRARLLAGRLQAAMHRRHRGRQDAAQSSRHGRARSQPRPCRACAAAPAAEPCRPSGRDARRRKQPPARACARARAGSR